MTAKAVDELVDVLNAARDPAVYVYRRDEDMHACCPARYGTFAGAVVAPRGRPCLPGSARRGHHVVSYANRAVS
ncbi:hypothetical protein MBOT_19870 [Mycobacterium botniense]|uniref:Uncharacterized protein n=1 Tax=Mycobacterium botniense TaxID=84962 RepID=A0A7I9XXV0_9MYCO|nr:hypothetical protein MBOT_19870 [Mycobacterium botniense]